MLGDKTMDLELYTLLRKADKDEILTIITMTLMYYTTKYDCSLSNTLRLIKKGYKELEKRKKM